MKNIVIVDFSLPKCFFITDFACTLGFGKGSLISKDVHCFMLEFIKAFVLLHIDSLLLLIQQRPAKYKKCTKPLSSHKEVEMAQMAEWRTSNYLMFECLPICKIAF